MPTQTDLLQRLSAEERRLLEQIVTSLEGLRFGSIEIMVHEGRIVQFERREKVRLDKRR